MARHRNGQPLQLIGWAGLALVVVLLFVVALVWSSWRTGLLAIRSNDIVLRMPAAPGLPRLPRIPMPDPQPSPLPGPGLKAET
ncbi:hypothetical protein [Caulobacter sp. DWR2-3-1b2]|uniref:hypothetical protein n=1 Tax=unclassified Caulobacter TaxID=2648921 RepID=UPI003CE8EF0A